MEKLISMKEIRKKLPVNDPDYIAFRQMKGILGKYDSDKMRKERIDEVIARYKRCT